MPMFAYIRIILASHGDRDVGDWTNVLFVVIMLVFWAIGGILKAKSGKAKAQREEGSARRRPGLGEDRQVPGKPVQVPSPRAIRTSEAEPGTERPIIRRVQRPIRARDLAAGLRSVSQELPACGEQDVHIELSEELQSLETKQQADRDRGDILLGLSPSPGLMFASSESRLGTRALLDLDSAEKLRKAILHYEVLGKPMALREPFS